MPAGDKPTLREVLRTNRMECSSALFCANTLQPFLLFRLIAITKRVYDALSGLLLFASLQFLLANPRLPETIFWQSERPSDRKSENSSDDPRRSCVGALAESQVELVSGELAQIWA